MEEHGASAIGEQGGLTFSHSVDGDVEVQEHDGSSSIPVRYPPMSGSTVDWSLLGVRQSTPLVEAERSKGKKGLATRGKGQGSAIRTDSGLGSSESTKEMLGRLGINIRKGQYSKRKGKKGHRGGQNRRRKKGFLSEEDFVEESGAEGSAPEGLKVAEAEAAECRGPGPEGPRGVESGEEEDAEKKTATRRKKTATRMKKTGSRRRTHVVTVEEGRLLRVDKGPKQNG